MCNGQTINLPFTDVMGSGFFCFIAQIYFQGITLGTSATTYSPTANVTRDQMAAFLGRTLDIGLKRGSRRAALDQFWVPLTRYDEGLGLTSIRDSDLNLLKSDGTDIWVADSGVLHRVRGSDGKLLGSWYDSWSSFGVLCALGRVFVTGSLLPSGRLYMIDPASAPGPVTEVANNLGAGSAGIAFDGAKIWTANNGSVSIITPTVSLPWSVNTVGGFGDLEGIIYDGANIWVTEIGAPGALKKLDASGGVLQTVTVGSNPLYPIFDGTNIWVPNGGSHSVSVVHAATGTVLATLTGNGLNFPTSAAFDGERVLITNLVGNLSLWKATNFAPLTFAWAGAGSRPYGACSDGINFWVTHQGLDRVGRL